MASTFTSEQARNELERAKAALAKAEEDFYRGAVGYERLAAVRQELSSRQGLLEATVAREARKAREAEAEAQRKIIEQKNRQKAERFLEKAPARLEAGEALNAVVLKAHAAFEGIETAEVDAVRFVLGVVVQTLETKAISANGRGELVRIRQNFLNDTSRDPLPRLRKEIAKAQETLASSNGHKKTDKERISK